MSTAPIATEPMPESLKALRDELAATFSGRCLLLKGENFSGRSRILRYICGLSTGQSKLSLPEKTAYVPPELSLSVSGLQSTVEEEILFHLNQSFITEPIEQLLDVTGLDALLERNPTTLSGGELALLVLISKLALSPHVLALDCALEQVAPAMKTTVCDLVTANRGFPSNFVLADNRLSETPKISRSVFEACHITVDPVNEPLNLAPLDSNFTPIPPSRTPCLELRNVSFSYSSRQRVLKDINLILNPGNVYLLQGRNGAGKSTLAKLLSGVLRPTGGSILADGRAIDLYRTPGQIANYVYQNPDMQFVADTVVGDLRLSAAIESKRQSEKRTEDALKTLGLHGVRNSEIAELPFVVRKRVSIAGALAALRPWLILDEPSLGQDDASVVAFARIIDNLCTSGYGVVIITHSTLLMNQLTGVPIKLVCGELHSLTR